LDFARNCEISEFILFDSLGMDIKEAVTILLSQGTSQEDIQQFINDAIKYQV
jgi:hypothetical protein